MSSTHPTEPQGETPMTGLDANGAVVDAKAFYAWIHTSGNIFKRAYDLGLKHGQSALSECRRELKRGRDARIQAETLAGLLDAAIRRLNELGDKSWKLPPYASRLASHAEGAGAEQEPCAWRYRYGKTGMWKYADRAEDTNQGDEYEREPLYPMPWQNQSPSPAPDSQAEELADLIRLLDQRYQDMGDTLARKAADELRSRQAPRGEAEVREACAKICERVRYNFTGGAPDWQGGCIACAAAIRTHPQSGESYKGSF